MYQFPVLHRSKPCRHGTMLYNVHDQYIGRSLDLYGEYSEGEVDLFRQMVKPGQVVLEVGANIGAHTVFLARAVVPGGRVLAFEPQRIVYQTLCANLALNNITNVYCWQAAVGRTPGEVRVPLLDYARPNNFGGVQLGAAGEGEPVPVRTIDGLQLPRCALIKVDVEGMEQEVVEGAVATLQRCQPLLYVENDRREKSASLIRTLDALGYKLFWHRPPLFNPNNFAGNPNNVFAHIVSANMLCCPKNAPYHMQGFDPVALPTSL
ncbi:MAG TPA: FkbM family methyltransferase [Gemmataceae bacterium]|jgi:FkbM family methyltransferase